MEDYIMHDPRNPINEIETEAEIVAKWTELDEANERIDLLEHHLEKLAEILQLESWGMTPTYEQAKEKTEILNQYTK